MAKSNIYIKIRKNEFEKLVKKAPQRASQIVRRTALRVKEVAAPFTPYETGALSGNVFMTMEGQFKAIVTWGQHYAIYQNFGTRYIAARGFAEKAIQALQPEFRRAIKEAFKL